MDVDPVHAGPLDAAEELRAVRLEQAQAVGQEAAVKAPALDVGNDFGQVGVERRLAAEDGHGGQAPETQGRIEVGLDLVQGFDQVAVEVVAEPAFHVAGPVRFERQVRDVPRGQGEPPDVETGAEVGGPHRTASLDEDLGLLTAGCWRRAWRTLSPGVSQIRSTSGRGSPCGLR